MSPSRLVTSARGRSTFTRGLRAPRSVTSCSSHVPPPGPSPSTLTPPVTTRKLTGLPGPDVSPAVLPLEPRAAEPAHLQRTPGLRAV